MIQNTLPATEKGPTNAEGFPTECVRTHENFNDIRKERKLALKKADTKFCEQNKYNLYDIEGDRPGSKVKYTLIQKKGLLHPIKKSGDWELRKEGDDKVMATISATGFCGSANICQNVYDSAFEQQWRAYVGTDKKKGLLGEIGGSLCIDFLGGDSFAVRPKNNDYYLFNITRTKTNWFNMTWFWIAYFFALFGVGDNCKKAKKYFCIIWVFLSYCFSRKTKINIVPYTYQAKLDLEMSYQAPHFIGKGIKKCFVKDPEFILLTLPERTTDEVRILTIMSALYILEKTPHFDKMELGKK